MPEHVNINECIKWIDKMNKAFENVGWNGRYIPATFSPRFGVIVGTGARHIVRHLFVTEKIKKYYEFKSKGSKGRAFAVEFQDQ
mgnify:FL=1